MNIDDIRDYIAARTDLVVGKDLFSYSMPAQVDRAVGVLLDPSMAMADNYLPGMYRNRVQVITRDTDFGTGRARSREVFGILRSDVPVTFPSFYAYSVLPTSAPIHYRHSDSDQIEFSTNFDVIYREDL